MKFWICIDGVKEWLLGTQVASAVAGLCTFTLDFYSNQTLTIAADGSWSATAGTGSTQQVFLVQADFALITPVQPVSPTSRVWGFKLVPYVAAA
jgi:hypothetical protein